MIVLGEIQIIDLALALRPLHHLLVDSPQDRLAGGDRCLKMKYHQRSCSIDSLVVVAWVVDLLVGRWGQENEGGLLTPK